MKLEVGKKYRRRDGTGPVEIVEYHVSRGYFIGHDKSTYTHKGIWGLAQYNKKTYKGQFDLVAEWDEPTPVQVGEKYKALEVIALESGGYAILQCDLDYSKAIKIVAAFTTIQEATAFIAAHLSAEGK
jgi:hypothetical protein